MDRLSWKKQTIKERKEAIRDRIEYLSNLLEDKDDDVVCLSDVSLEAFMDEKDEGND